MILFGGPLGTVSELLFESKKLIPALQQMLTTYHVAPCSIEVLNKNVALLST